MNKKYLLAAFTIFIFFSANAQWTWLKKTSLPAFKRDRAFAFSIGNFGYFGTGLDSNNIVLNDFWRYDSVSNTWSQMANFGGVARNYAVGISINGKGYAGLGLDDSDAVSGNAMEDWWQYDPVLNSWTAKATYANGTTFGNYKNAAAAVNGKGYVVTGRTYYGVPHREVWEYDPINDTWTQKNMFPPIGGRNGATAFGLNGKIYVGCGSDDNYFYNDFWEYNPSNDSWLQRANFPGTERSGAVSFSLDTCGFIGLGLDGGYAEDFWKFNPNTNHWSYVNLFDGAGRRCASCFTIGNRAYVCSGKTSTGNKRDLWQLHFTIQWAADANNLTGENIFTVFPNPAQNEIQITNHKLKSGDEIKIFNLSGQLVFDENVTSIEHPTFNIQHLANGIYLVQLSSTENSNVFASQKITILHD